MTPFEKYLQQHNTTAEAFYQVQVKQAKIRAVILGSVTIVSLIFCLFAYLQKVEAANNKVLFDQMKVLADYRTREMLSLENENHQLKLRYDSCSNTSK
jgi:hypothetical protein